MWEIRTDSLELVAVALIPIAGTCLWWYNAQRQVVLNYSAAAIGWLNILKDIV